MRQEVGIEGNNIGYLVQVFYLYQIHCSSKLPDRRSGRLLSCNYASSHRPGSVSTQDKLKIISCAKLLFLPCCLSSGRKHIPRLIWLSELKTENNTPPSWQPGYSSNKKPPRQSRLLWLRDKLCLGKRGRSLKELHCALGFSLSEEAICTAHQLFEIQQLNVKLTCQ